MDKNNLDKEKEPQNVVVSLSFSTMLFIVLLIVAKYFGSQLLSVFIYAMLTIIFMSTALPIVRRLVNRGISRKWSIFITYISIFIVMIVISSAVIIPFINQSGAFMSTLPVWVEDVINKIEGISIAGRSLNLSTVQKSILEFLKSIPSADNVKNITSALAGLFGSLSLLLTAFISSIYLVSEHDQMLDVLLLRISTKEKKNIVKNLIRKTESRLGHWVLGQGFVSGLATIYSAIALSILNIPFAIPLAVFVGLMGLVPNFGATFAGLAISLVGLVTVGPAKAFIALAVFILYQPLENNYISPKVMGSAVGLKPLFILVGVMVMFLLFGAVGALVTIPVMVLLEVAYEFYIDLQKLKAKGTI